MGAPGREGAGWLASGPVPAATPAATAVLTGAAAFAAMEPVAYAAHRFVMHGPGWGLHRSHHGDDHAGLEANDLFPVAFAAATVTAMAVGSRVRQAHLLVPAGVGVTCYGLAYTFVHDVYIHARLAGRVGTRRLPWLGPLERLRRAHELHHRYGGEPFGMLLPIVPRAMAALRQDATLARRANTS